MESGRKSSGLAAHHDPTGRASLTFVPSNKGRLNIFIGIEINENYISCVENVELDAIRTVFSKTPCLS